MKAKMDQEDLTSWVKYYMKLTYRYINNKRMTTL